VSYLDGVLASEEDAMPHIYYCPECKSEHDQPAQAYFALAVICLDCG
jgi:hydrogenase maturation factor HypF (carbamoyltransferase family)